MPSIPSGPNNPHPLSRLPTELVWEGKHDEHDRRREVDAAGASIPLQKIEMMGDETKAQAWLRQRG